MSDNETDSVYTSGQNIRKAVHKRFGYIIIGIAVIGIFLIIVSVICPFGGCILVSFLKKTDMLKDFQGFVSSIQTVLGAAVIFYYSVKDNHSEGIPPRTIMSYSFGSWAIPILFSLSTIMVIYVIAIRNLGNTFWALAGSIYTILVQFMCVGLILISTSYNYSLHVICNAEIRQFQYIFRKENQDRETAMWIYMMYHIEQAVKSDDLMGDRMVLSQKLIRTPFYAGERILSRNLYMDFRRIYIYQAYQFYEYYYNNLLAALEHLSDKGHKEERMKMYQLLYEFVKEADAGCSQLVSGDYEYFPDIENLCGEERNREYIFEREGRKLRKYECTKRFLALVSAVINAVLFADLEESEEFCHYILNVCIVHSGMREYQVKLYFLYQELLYHIKKAAIKLSNVRDLTGITIPGKLDPVEQKIYEEVWGIWCKDINLSNDSKSDYLYKALVSLVGLDRNSEPVAYIVMQWKKAGRT